jgi:hypothetical protein
MRFDLSMDLNDPNICLDILKQIKPTRVEGYIIEYEFQLIFRENLEKAGYQFLDALVLRRIPSKTNKNGNRPAHFLIISSSRYRSAG